jgi:hypothetical protein
MPSLAAAMVARQTANCRHARQGRNPLTAERLRVAKADLDIARRSMVRWWTG